ncbi:MAG: hypothetical protein PUF79_01580 [Lactobacillaceae bacterium]|nr:hypothetical protein [Lactobacillaceae bacterium]
MALTKEKSVSLSGRSIIGNVEVARFSAQVATDENDSTTMNTYINDQAAYRKNLKAVRADSDEFRAYVRDEEDKIFAEAESTTNEDTETKE